MPDLYEYLISGTPQQAQIPVLVEELRKRRAFGELGALTGDRVLAPFGQNMSRQADSYAQQLQDTRQRDTDNAQTKSYQDAQIAHQKEVLAATLARDRANQEHQQRADSAAQLRAEAAMERARRTGAVGGKPMNNQAMNTLAGLRQQVDKIGNLKSSFKDKYARLSAPGFRTLKNVGARYGLGSEADKAAAEWWRQFQLDYNILARNEQFGATLSPNEKQSWAQANAGEEMDSNQIKTILGTMERWYRKDMEERADLYSMTYNPDQVAVAIGREPPNRAAQPAEDDVTDFFDLYEQDPEMAVDIWNQTFPGVVNPADRPAQ